MNSLQQGAGLPFSISLVDDNDKARCEIEEILTRRFSVQR